MLPSRPMSCSQGSGSHTPRQHSSMLPPAAPRCQGTVHSHACIHIKTMLTCCTQPVMMKSMLYDIMVDSAAPSPHYSCFLLTMKDDSIEGIYDTLKQCALISKSAGGIGLNVHCIRASGSYISGTNGTSNGLVPMLRVYNNTGNSLVLPSAISDHIDLVTWVTPGSQVLKLN